MGAGILSNIMAFDGINNAPSDYFDAAVAVATPMNYFEVVKNLKRS